MPRLRVEGVGAFDVDGKRLVLAIEEEKTPYYLRWCASWC